MQSLMQTPEFNKRITLLSPSGRGWIWLSKNKLHGRAEEGKESWCSFSSAEGATLSKNR